MGLDKTNVAYFSKQIKANERFWERFPQKPDFYGAAVLEVGSGLGALTLDMAASGAARVVGIDLNAKVVEFAQENLCAHYASLQKRVHFVPIGLEAYDRNALFDFIVSKESLEHMPNVPDILSQMKSRLKKGGKIYLGFGPLYLSCFGDHGYLGAKLPWGHLIFPEKILLERLNRHRERKIMSVTELSLNKLPFHEYKRMLLESGMAVEYLKTNCGRHPALKVFSLLSQIPGLREYFTVSVYCILKKTE